MARSKIEWLARPGTVPESWNPVTGCTPISEGCAHCYAERMSKRLAGRAGYPEKPNQFDVTLHPDKLGLPMKWRKPRTVFVVSMGDLFHKDVPWDYRESILGMMAANQRHTFIVLTKRPDRMLEFFTDPHVANQTWPLNPHYGQHKWPFRNVWLGATVENDKHYDRIHDLLQCPAAVRFVSVEPMLGPVKLFGFGSPTWGKLPPSAFLNWVILGGETGPGARPMHPDWARGVRDQCVTAGVPFFFKQMSSRMPIPDDLMIKEWPK